jgi:hypothetical protein
VLDDPSYHALTPILGSGCYEPVGYVRFNSFKVNGSKPTSSFRVSDMSSTFRVRSGQPRWLAAWG